VRQTGVREETLRRHYEHWWPRDREKVQATYAALDPTLERPKLSPNVPGPPKKPVYTANRKWMTSPSRTT
jgi:hypothetical protein